MIPILEEDQLKFLEILGNGVSGIVRKAKDIESNKFLALKYFKIDINHREIAYENLILQKIEEINHPNFLKFKGIRRDPKNQKNLILLMESGETSLDNLLRNGLKFTQEEGIFFLMQAVDQLVLLQKNGISNRDIKPDNFLILKEDSYQFRVADFSIGHINEFPNTNQIPINELSGYTLGYESPEVNRIFKKLNNKLNESIPKTYDPYKSDVFSLGKCLRKMIDRSEKTQEIDEIIDLMIKDEPNSRISFFELKEKLAQPKFMKLMKAPNKEKIEAAISKWNEKKNKEKTLEERLANFFESFKLYYDIAHLDETQKYATIIENLISKELNPAEKDPKKTLSNLLLSEIYNGLAIFFEELGKDFDKAETLYKKSLEISDKLSDLKDFFIQQFQGFNNLANFYKNIRLKYDEAEKYYRENLKLSKSFCGKDHLITALAYNNFGTFFDKIKKDNKKAEKYYLKYLEINQRKLGEINVDTLVAYNNLAAFYQDVSQNYKKAEEYFKKCLEISQKLYGEEHSDTALSYKNLGCFYKKIDCNFEKAENYYKKSLAIDKKIYGKEHPHIAETYNNLAVIYEEFHENHTKAEKYYRKSLEMNRKILGEENLNTLLFYFNIAVFYKNNDENIEQAKTYLEKCLNSYLMLFGENDHRTARCFGHLAQIYEITLDYIKAEEYFLKNLNLNKNLLGEEHNDTACSYEALASFYQTIESYEIAQNYFEKGLNIKRRLHGEEHVEVGESYYDYAEFVLEYKNDTNEAANYMMNAYEIFKKNYGEDHCKTRDCLEELNDLLKS